MTPAPAPPPIWVVIPVHNRRETTLGCLRHLRTTGALPWLHVCVVDDGSDDGTSAAIQTEFPTVTVLRGDGQLWWAGAICLGMRHALAAGAATVLWLNDDCRPPGSALEKLCALAAQTSGVVWIDARAPGGWSYGAHRKTLWRVRRCTPAEEAQGKIDTFSGNCVGLPRAWIERVGLPHAHLFPHGIADLDYGLRLHAAGAPLRRLPGVVAANADPSPASSESWRTSPRPMRAIWRDFSSPRSFFHFPAWRRFALRHWGPVWGWAVFAAPYVRWAAIAVLRTVSSPNAPGKASR